MVKVRTRKTRTRKTRTFRVQSGGFRLHKAVESGFLEDVKNEIKYGEVGYGFYSINSKDYYGFTALMLACRNCDVKIASYLLENGASPEGISKDGDTNLHYAALCYEPKLLEILLPKIPHYLNLKNKTYGWTPLMVAVFYNKIKHVQLMGQYPSLDLNLKNNENKTVFDLAKSQEMKRLLETIKNNRPFNSAHTEPPRPQPSAYSTPSQPSPRTYKDKLIRCFKNKGTVPETFMESLLENIETLSGKDEIAKQIDKNYKKIALRTHPNKGGSTVDFQYLGQAKDILMECLQ